MVPRVTPAVGGVSEDVINALLENGEPQLPGVSRVPVIRVSQSHVVQWATLELPANAHVQWAIMVLCLTQMGYQQAVLQYHVQQATLELLAHAHAPTAGMGLCLTQLGQ